MTDWITKKAEVEREWFKQEHERQFGKPPHTQEEKQIDINKVVAKIEKLSKRKVCERKYFSPTIELPPPIVQIVWDAPLALHCACPTGDCSCSCKGNTLLPKKRLPIVPRYNWWGIRPVLCKLHIVKCPKPAGDLARHFAEVVQKESKFYKSKQGREILTERGPEFCLSGCLKFFITNKKIDKDYAKVIQEMKSQIASGKVEEVQEEQPEVKEKKSTDRICDQFQCTVSTQSQVDENGDFIIGDYSHLIFGIPDEELLCDIEGAELSVASYKGPVCEPREPGIFLGVVRTAGKLFHVTDIKQRISQVKKDLITSIFEIREKCHSKASQYEFKDLPIEVPEGVCESLADVRRKRKEKECLQRNKRLEEENNKIEGETCYCKFRHKQVTQLESSYTTTKINETKELNNLMPFKDSTRPLSTDYKKTENAGIKSLSDAHERPNIEIPQRKKDIKDTADVGIQTSFIRSFEDSNNESFNTEKNAIDVEDTANAEEDKKLGVRFSEAVTIDLMPEFDKFDKNYAIVSQEAKIQTDNKGQPLTHQENQNSVNLLDDKVNNNDSKLMKFEKKIVHGTISEIISEKIVTLQLKRKFTKGTTEKGDVSEIEKSNLGASSCRPCTQVIEPLKPLKKRDLKENLEISNANKENQSFRKPTDMLSNIKKQNEIQTEYNENRLTEIKTIYEDGTCQPCDELLNTDKLTNKALFDLKENTVAVGSPVLENTKHKIKYIEKSTPAKQTEDTVTPKRLTSNVKDKDEATDQTSANPINDANSITNKVEKKLSMTEQFKKIPSTESKIHTQPQKSSAKEILPELIEVIKKASITEKSKEELSIMCKINSQIQKPTSKSEFSEILELKKEESKTDVLKDTSSICQSHSQIRERDGKGRFPELQQIITKESKIDKLNDSSNICNNYSQAKKLSSDERVPELYEIKPEISNTDEIKNIAGALSKVCSQTVKPCTKTRLSELANLKQEISKADEIKKVDSMVSRIGLETKPNCKDRPLELAKVKQEISKSAEIKNVANKLCKICSQTKRSSCKDMLPELAEVKKEISKTRKSKYISRVESKMNNDKTNEISYPTQESRVSKTDSLVQKLSSKDNRLKLQYLKKEVLKTEVLKDPSSLVTKNDPQTQELNSKDIISKLTVVQKKVAKTYELKEIFSKESNIQAQKSDNKDWLSELEQFKIEISNTENLKEVPILISPVDSQTLKPTSKENILKLSEVKTKTNGLKRVLSEQIKIQTQSTEKVFIKKLEHEALRVFQEYSQRIDIKNTIKSQLDDTKDVAKETKPEVTGPCPVRKVTNSKESIRRSLVPQDIPKHCKDATCEPCHKIKALEKVIHEAVSDMEHSESNLQKGNSEKESEVKKTADVAISQLSTDGNNGPINAFNRKKQSKQFTEVRPYDGTKLHETNNIFKSYVINSDLKLNELSSDVEKYNPQKDNAETLQDNTPTFLKIPYLTPLEKLLQIKDFIKNYLLPIGLRTSLDKSPIKENISMKKSISGKSVPILKLRSAEKKMKSSEKIKQVVSFKEKLEFNCDKNKHCKSCNENCCRSRKDISESNESFNKKFETFIVASHEKLSSAAVAKSSKKTIRKIYNKVCKFNWKTLLSYPLGNKNLEINREFSKWYDGTISNTRNDTKLKNDNVKFKDEEDIKKKNIGMKYINANKNNDMVVQEVISDREESFDDSVKPKELDIDDSVTSGKN